MVAAAQRSGVQRYLQMSALGTRAEAISGYHRTKWRGEQLVRDSGLALDHLPAITDLRAPGFLCQLCWPTSCG